MLPNNHCEKLAKILRVDKHLMADLEGKMGQLTGRKNVLMEIVEENEAAMLDRMQQLGLPKISQAREIYDALISKIEADDFKLFKAANIATARSFEAAEKICVFAKRIILPAQGFFIKHEKAREFLKSEPPRKILEALGYTSVAEMLAKEDLLEIYSALRFLEDAEWQNNVFFKQYEKLRPEDFEEREIEIRALGEKWAKAAEKFVAKKYHNVSHLKELGVIFVVPIFLGISGETLRPLSLLAHYSHEVKYYSELFKHFATGPIERFASRVVSLLRGDVMVARFAGAANDGERSRWLIIQRYLAKDDENDWRLFEPHINPEALHWERAADDLAGALLKVGLPANGLEFWRDLGWVGDYFPTEAGLPVLVSFNLVDTVMSLVKQKELVKYLYHQQEALWNKIFMSYLSQNELEEYSKKYIVQGWFEL